MAEGRKLKRRAVDHDNEEGGAAQSDIFDLVAERERISNGLSKCDPAVIVARLKRESVTEEGLRALARMLPESVLPTPEAKYCVSQGVRCIYELCYIVGGG